METSLLDVVRNGLEQLRGDWPALASESGVPYSTVVKIAQGQTPNPRIQTVEALARVIRLRQPGAEAAVGASGADAAQNTEFQQKAA